MSNTTETILRYTITASGSKMELFQQLLNIGLVGADGKRIRNLPLFRVNLKPEDQFASMSANQLDHLSVQEVSADDGSGNNWYIAGNYPSYAPGGEFGSRRGGRFYGYINTQTRKGWLEVTYS